LRCVVRIAAWCVDFGQKHAQTGLKLQRVAIIGAHDATFLATLKIADLRSARGKKERDREGERAHQ
jgi:hypothetical protein